jgi:hypothetical protein
MYDDRQTRKIHSRPWVREGCAYLTSDNHINVLPLSRDLDAHSTSTCPPLVGSSDGMDSSCMWRHHRATRETASHGQNEEESTWSIRLSASISQSRSFKSRSRTGPATLTKSAASLEAVYWPISRNDRRRRFSWRRAGRLITGRANSNTWASRFACCRLMTSIAHRAPQQDGSHRRQGLTGSPSE